MSVDRVEYTCPRCQLTVMAPPSLAGEAADCPLCGREVDRWPQPNVTPAEIADTPPLRVGDKVESARPSNAVLALGALRAILIVSVIAAIVYIAVKFWVCTILIVFIGLMALIADKVGSNERSASSGLSGGEYYPAPRRGWKLPKTSKRPLNACGSCGHTWFPRGSNHSRTCPSCGKAR